ncbi:unnamed protein product [Didymodactylos carnosus]|uniref:MEMO1 family protein n=1 Tax=Didymodactylos carnosus TaxID=1234261 RepID=A0A814TBH2_9BILA|nr:unnamed protein product [Didymodactylos carnosus]CAF1157242.1 unnamed protein product [Didymodactylos carnosus]CAF3896559.1 unnamed protein product [Didymodactylos carnosus]CAF3920785.1 unnamed protein product [Didymodactylos carnosus]
MSSTIFQPNSTYSFQCRSPLCLYYSSSKNQCLEQIISSYIHPFGPGELPLSITSKSDLFIPCLLVPHGAYCDSGPLYAHAYYWLSKQTCTYDSALILGTNHRGVGSSIALSPDHWQTPLGLVECDTELLDALVSVGIPVDREAHRQEHSIENQLPFLKHLLPNIKTVALSFSSLSIDKAYKVCEQIKKAIQKLSGKRIVIISTTDYTHYGPSYGNRKQQQLTDNEQYARLCDQPILKSILSNNPEELLHIQQTTQHTMCGLWPTIIVLILSKLLNDDKGQWKLLCYNISSEIMKRNTVDVNGFASLVYDKLVKN